jgi:hypothetical protein
MAQIQASVERFLGLESLPDVISLANCNLAKYWVAFFELRYLGTTPLAGPLVTSGWFDERFIAETFGLELGIYAYGKVFDGDFGSDRYLKIVKVPAYIEVIK